MSCKAELWGCVLASRGLKEHVSVAIIFSARHVRGRSWPLRTALHQMVMIGLYNGYASLFV